ncbi:MAG: neutral/alkaline non-lysosomal ceramidase N-terminal domain-containing protein, partial [Solirubrobacterales bacterium]
MRRRTWAAALAAVLVVLAGQATIAQAKPGKHPYLVGAATRSINPDPDGTFAGKPVYLGGYGIGGGSPVFEGRPATGVLGEGLSVRAFAVSDGQTPFVVADIESQGWFVAVKNGPYGLLDMRKEVERRTGGALRAENVVIQSNHSHSGPDPLGVWGGVPEEYLRHVTDRTVEAIVAAHSSMAPAQLYYGTAPGRDLLSNQFDYDEANKAVDSDVRVLQARNGKKPLVTLLNFSAHTTVLGSSNTKVSGDWVQAANPLLEQRFGGRAVTMVGTLGRTQPADRGCADPAAAGEDAQNLCMIRDYATRVVDRAAQAAAVAQPLSGPASVAARSYLVEDVATNALILGLEYAGGTFGVPLNRAMTPPWLTGNVLGSVTASARIGDVLLSAGPGEMYPQIPLKVAELVGARGHMTAGLAGDQLGYLIAPFEAYPEPVRRSFFNQRGDEVSPIDNDNYFFNVSHTMGERVTCSLLRGAGEVLGRGLEYRSRYDR